MAPVSGKTTASGELNTVETSTIPMVHNSGRTAAVIVRKKGPKVPKCGRVTAMTDVNRTMEQGMARTSITTTTPTSSPTTPGSLQTGATVNMGINSGRTAAENDTACTALQGEPTTKCDRAEVGADEPNSDEEFWGTLPTMQHASFANLAGCPQERGNMVGKLSRMQRLGLQRL